MSTIIMALTDAEAPSAPDVDDKEEDLLMLLLVLLFQ